MYCGLTQAEVTFHMDSERLIDEPLLHIVDYIPINLV